MNPLITDIIEKFEKEFAHHLEGKMIGNLYGNPPKMLNEELQDFLQQALEQKDQEWREKIEGVPCEEIDSHDYYCQRYCGKEMSDEIQEWKKEILNQKES